MMKRWVTKEPVAACAAQDIELLANMRDVHQVTAQLLANRGILEHEVNAFLYPSWKEGIHSPFLFAQMRDATTRIFRAFEQGERITVHGDYDADGVTGSAVIITILREIEAMLPVAGRHAAIDWYIPHRDREGYGLNSTSVELLAARGTKLIITVDCGIANVEEIAKAKTLGMETIVVDHHQFGDTLPQGILIHPRLPGETYPFPHLAAVGVAWKLACAMYDEARVRGLPIAEGREKWLLDLVSIATVTDMVPMIGENRTLETFGLMVLNKTRRPGLKALIEISGQELGSLDTESVGFGLGPRINAAGRMDHASLALELMLAETDDEAQRACQKIELCNKERQKAVVQMMIEAEEQFRVHPDMPVIAFVSENWPPALVGLVAGKFMERTGKPVIAIGKHGNRWVGSGRSFSWYDITAGMKRAGEGILTHCGGHIQACGFSFSDAEQTQELIKRIWDDAVHTVDATVAVPTLLIDADVRLEQLDWALVQDIEKLQPFGEQNRKPLFATYGLECVEVTCMGKTQKHIRVSLRSAAGRLMKFVGFNMAHRLQELGDATHVDVAFELGVNEWNGKKDIQCKLVDIRPAHI